MNTTIKQIKRLFLLLCLIVAGAQSAWAQWTQLASYTKDDITYYVYKEANIAVPVATIVSIDGIGAVESQLEVNATTSIFNYIPTADVSAVGWYYDQQKAFDVTCTSTLTSLKLHGRISLEIHGNFTIQNLYGPLLFSEVKNSQTYRTIISSDATLNIPHATSFSTKLLKVEGTINAPSIPTLTIPTFVSGTINAQAATSVIMPNSSTLTGVINAPAATDVTISNGTKLFGTINATSATNVTISSGASITGTINTSATNVELGSNLFGTIKSNSLKNITLKGVDFSTSGMLDCPQLMDIYIPDKNYPPTFYGSYSDHFTAPSNSITVHVYDMTPNEIEAMKNSNVWSGFKEIVNHKSNVNYTITSDGNANVTLYKLLDKTTYATAESLEQRATLQNGSKSGTLKTDNYYAVEIKDVNPDIQTVYLTRNGSVVELSKKEGVNVYYYDEPNPQEDVNYEVSITNSICNLTLLQTEYWGNITYTKTTNGTTSSRIIYGSSNTIACSQGSTIELSIPYNDYTPKSLVLDDTFIIPLTLANGRATATINVPAEETATVKLTWQAPQTSYTHHQPQIMIVRSGEGDVKFKGLFSTNDAQQIDHWFVEENVNDGTWLYRDIVDCSESVTTITVPDVDDANQELGEGCWGFRAVITPVKGQVLKMLLLGHISEDEDGRQVLNWEDMLHGNYSSNNLYLKYDQDTNTYTLTEPGDYQNFGPTDYVLNIAMGPDETTIETGKTLNFVRKGGRMNSYLSWYEGEKSFNIEEGSSSVLVPNGELEYDDMALVIVTEEGETFRVYKNGADITSQFQNTWGANYYHAELDTESATYTVHIDGAPDANPVWNVQQHEGVTGTQIVVSRNEQADETIDCNNSIDELTIDDSDVTKVTLKVPVSTEGESAPLLVLKNGMDVSYQFKEIANGMLTYEVPKSTLYNTNWDISYDLSHQQTFIVKGGTNEKVLEIEHEYMGNAKTIEVAPDGLASFYLAPFNNTYNRFVYMTIYVPEGEKLKVLRNGIDVTNKFERIYDPSVGESYELNVVDAEYANNSTLSALGFDIREAAVWQIIIGAEETGTTLRVTTMDGFQQVILIDKDGNEITYSSSGNVIEWPEGEPLTVEAYTPLGNWPYEAQLIVDGIIVPLEYDAEKDRFTGYELSAVNAPHTIVLQMKKVKNTFMAFVGTEHVVAIAELDADGNVIMEGGGGPECIGMDIANTSGVKLTFKPAEGYVLTKLAMDACTIPLDNENLTLKANGDYEYILPAGTISTGTHQVYATFSYPEGDLTHDGKVNITDVTKMVNIILGKP